MIRLVCQPGGRELTRFDPSRRESTGSETRMGEFRGSEKPEGLLASMLWRKGMSFKWVIYYEALTNTFNLLAFVNCRTIFASWIFCQHRRVCRRLSAEMEPFSLFQIYLCLSIGSGNRSGVLCPTRKDCVCFADTGRRQCIKEYHRREDFSTCRNLIEEYVSIIR